MRNIIIAVIAVLFIAGGATYYTKFYNAAPTTAFRTAAVKQGDVISTINATGTIEAEERVDVGAQIVGIIKDLGIEPSELNGRKPADLTPEEKAKLKRIDYCSEVEEGTELAYIDDAVYKAQVDQAEATYLRAVADLGQYKAKLLQAEQDRKRAEELRTIEVTGMDRPVKGIADSDYDLAVANYEVAKANVKVGEATIRQAEAALNMAKTNFGYTVIKSPVKGTIIDRRVDIGQTVVSNLSAASVVLIAKDLRRMEVWAQVNEADIGRIRSIPNMPVRFTVDAYPGEVFKGTVSQIRLNATITQNVVTYTVVVTFDNSDLKLFPYMTASLQFEIENHENVLSVPNAALRWKPKPEQIARAAAPSAPAGTGDAADDSQTDAKTVGKTDVKADGKATAITTPDPKTSGDPPAGKTSKSREDRGRLWVKDGNYVRPVDVQIGITDGTNTEVNAPDLKSGMEVVVSDYRPDSSDAGDTTNPFAPKIFRPGTPQQKPKS
jgi:HlyD family secretion protein